jgi:tRNA modification GTPase
VDISLHGGPRIVERVLLLLKRLGVRVDSASEFLAVSWPAANAVQQEVLAALPRAKTRAAAAWLAQMTELLPATVEQIIHKIQARQTDGARAALEDLISQSDPARYLLEGIRVALIGEPNAGKSTLANALARREHAIVSDTPGTTRDWVEHPAAVCGVPVTFVDTAGIRRTHDPIERQAVLRAADQVKRADIVLYVIDASSAPTPADQQAIAGQFDAIRPHHRDAKPLVVLNKCDLPAHPQWQDDVNRHQTASVLISARTGQGLDALRRRLTQLIGWPGSLNGIPAPFSSRQLDACRRALSALGGHEPDCHRAADALHFFVHAPPPAEDRSNRGYNEG